MITYSGSNKGVIRAKERHSIFLQMVSKRKKWPLRVPNFQNFPGEHAPGHP